MPDSTSPIFLDTAYIYALVNTRDQWHQQAVQWQRKLASERRTLITTELILVEIADGLAAVRFRTQAMQIVRTLQASPFVEVVPSSTQLLDDALELYRQRADKDWGLTDCASFITMGKRGLSETLTTDEHFQQAGFRALLRES
jgi:predicted nucleic acid-binding protein